MQLPPNLSTESGQAHFCSPVSQLLCSPPTPLLLRPSLWFPSRAAYPEAGSFLVRLAHAPADAPASEIWVRVSVLLPAFSWRARALPGFWVVLFAPAAIQDPAQLLRPPSPRRLWRSMLLPSGKSSPSAPGTEFSRLHFRGLLLRVPTHRRCGYPPPSQGLASGSPGSALTGRGSHPRDD